MNIRKPSMILVIAELLVGLFFAGVGVFFLVEVSKCGPRETLCGLGLIPVILCLVPGCVTLAVGTFSYFTSELKYWAAQRGLGIFLLIYYVVLMLIWFMLVR